MAQRDYEEQPEAPDLGAAVQLETAESLVGPADGNDAVDAGYWPPDRPYVLDDELTVAGQAEGETLDERLAQEVPEDVPVHVAADLELDPGLGRDPDFDSDLGEERDPAEP